MHLDHFVVHVDDKQTPTNARNAIEAAGFPFNPRKGKGDRGFHATNIWIGKEYFEIAWLKNQDGGAWIPEWVDRYNEGRRGLNCLFLRVENIEHLRDDLLRKNLQCRLERTSYKTFFGLYTVKLPWKTLLLPPVPGCNFEISFIQYDPGVVENYMSKIKPNSKEYGITGISSGDIYLPNFNHAVDYLKNIFSNYEENRESVTFFVEGGKLKVMPLKVNDTSEHITFYADTDGSVPDGSSFILENINVVVKH